MHRFYIDGHVDNRDKNVVFGAFLYQDFPLPQRQKEIDIEFSRFGEAEADNLWYVVWGPGDNHHPHSSSFSLAGDFSAHSFNWQPTQIDFESHHGHYDKPPSPQYVIAEWAYTGEYVPHEVDNLHIHLNLWLFRGGSPSDGQEVEVIIRHADLPAPLPADIVVMPAEGLVTTEAGGTATFTVQLTREPTADLNIGISPSDSGEGMVSPDRLVFTSATWNEPQTVTVTGVDDYIDDAGAAYTIVVAPVASADPRYKGIDGADVSVTNTDDDTAGVTVTPTAGLVTSEAGHQETFAVRLDSQPLADVEVLVSTGDAEEGLVSVDQRGSAPAQGPTDSITLTFNHDDWHVPQEVIITGVWDGIVDGDIPYSIHVGPPQSDDEKYNGHPHIDVSVSNMDVLNPWRNPLCPTDVNRDGHIAPVDVLVIVNDVNRYGSRELELPPPIKHWCLDVNGDGYVTPNDVLRVINDLNRSGARPCGEPEFGESEAKGLEGVGRVQAVSLVGAASQQAGPVATAYETTYAVRKWSISPERRRQSPRFDNAGVSVEAISRWQQSNGHRKRDDCEMSRKPELVLDLELEDVITDLAADAI